MSYHFVEISGFEKTEVYCKDRQLYCKIGETIRQLPFEDVAAILITTPTCTLHSHVLAEASQRHIPVVVCDGFKPSGIFLPIQRSTDTLLTRAQIEAPTRLRTALWLKTLDAKCENQLCLAEALNPKSQMALEQMRVLCAQSSPTKEGPCAHLYWDVCSDALAIEAFSRNPAENEGVNSLLNYAYAILLTQTLQKLLLLGLDPMYGIGHVVKERATPLAYDIMEPFRPLLDAYVFKWLEWARMQKEIPTVNKAYKTYLRQCLAGNQHDNHYPLNDILQETIKTLRQAFLEKSPKPYRPWQQKTIKWDGYLSALISPS